MTATRVAFSRLREAVARPFLGIVSIIVVLVVLPALDSDWW